MADSKDKQSSGSGSVKPVKKEGAGGGKPGAKGAPQQAGKPFVIQAVKKQAYEKEGFRGIIRIVGKDINGHWRLEKALQRVRGVGSNLADTISQIAFRDLKIDPSERVGNLTEQQVDQIEEIVQHPEKHGVPIWALNRRKDPSTGIGKHLVMADLDFNKRLDIEAEKTIRSYRGVRHAAGLTVRGQRTRTAGRTGMTLGVVKKKLAPAKAGDTPKK